MQPHQRRGDETPEKTSFKMPSFLPLIIVDCAHKPSFSRTTGISVKHGGGDAPVSLSALGSHLTQGSSPRKPPPPQEVNPGSHRPTAGHGQGTEAEKARPGEAGRDLLLSSPIFLYCLPLNLALPSSLRHPGPQIQMGRGQCVSPADHGSRPLP